MVTLGQKLSTLFGVVLCFSIAPSIVFADYVLYNLPGTNLIIPLEGKTKVNPGATLSLRHPMGVLTFSLNDVRIIKTKSPQTVHAKEQRTLQSDPSLQNHLRVALHAVRTGLLDECKRTLGKAYQLYKNDPQMAKLAGLMTKIKQTTELDQEGITVLKKALPGTNFKSAQSRHFLLVHDTEPGKQTVDEKVLKKRLDLLEKVYESYFLTFALKGLVLDPPEKRLNIVLFSDHAKFLQLERQLEMRLTNVAGFYIPDKNFSVFYDSATTAAGKQLQEIADTLTREINQLKRRRLPGVGELVRFEKTLQLLIKIENESEDVTVVSHEVVHHLAGNTKLFPRDGTFVRWVHEGLASYFESAKLARWNGVGVVDGNRIAYYRELSSDPERGSLEFVASDLGFVIDQSLHSQLGAYGQAWALTHYLFNERFEDLIEYYRAIQKLEGEVTDVASVKARANDLLEVFEKTFGSWASVDRDWRRYMRSLKTDLEQLGL